MSNQLQGVPFGQSPWGHCHRCGAPKAPMFVGRGQMILCTRCTSGEDQKARIDFIEMGKKLGQAQGGNDAN